MTDRSPSWPDEMDAAERVRHVALTRTTPRNAGWVADEANVSRDTAVKHLTRLVERGEVESVETTAGTCYSPDEVTQFLRHVRSLAEEHTVDELTEELRAIGEEIDAWKATYDVEDIEALRKSVGDDDLSPSERRERVEIVEEWAYDAQIREALRLAISLASSLTKLDVPFHLEANGSGTLPQEG